MNEFEETREITTETPVAEPTAPIEQPTVPTEPIAPIEQPTVERPTGQPPVLPVNAIRFEPTAEPRPPKTPDKGLRVFLMVVAAVMAICLLLTAGYLAGSAGWNKKSEVPAAVVSKPSDGKTKSAAEIYDAMLKTVVSVQVFGMGDAVNECSGVVFNDDGYIVINDHAYSGIPAARFLVMTADGTVYDAHYVAGDSRSDLAVIKVDTATDLVPAVFGNSEETVVGDSALAIGFSAGSEAAPSLTVGYVSNTALRVSGGNTQYSYTAILTDTALNPGSWGGALLNAYGQIIGITSSKIVGDNTEDMNLSIPSNRVVTVVNSLIASGYVTDRARLGVSYTVNSVLQNRLDETLPVGLVIQTISEDSPLALTDAAVGDIITAVNGAAITKSDIMLDVIEAAKPGDTITLSVYHTASDKTDEYTVALLEDKGSSSYVMSTSGNDSTVIG